MCEPTTILAVASIATTVVAGAYAADQQRQAGKYEQEVAEQNAKVAGIQAEQARQTGNINEERARMRVRQMLGQQRATFAANGVDAGTGTALDVLGDTAGFGFGDASQERANALREAWGYQVGQANEKNRGKFARWNGNAQATGTLLTTGAQAMGMWSQAGFGSGASRTGASAAGPYRAGYRYPGG